MQQIVRPLLLLPLLSSCGGMAFFGSSELHPIMETGVAAPVLANAGGDREVLRGYPTDLDGRGTYHPLGAAFTVKWEQVGGDPIYLSNPAALTPSLVAPLDEQTLVFRLTAADGRFSTSADVKLFVRNRPQSQPPRVRAGPDRFLTPTEQSEPTAADLLDAGRTGTTVNWRRVVVDRLTDADHALPEIFALHGEADGLAAAPDFLLLWPSLAESRGQRAPLANLAVARDTVDPGALIELDARGSTDPNGDGLRWRWEQTRGEPVLPTKATTSLLSVTAPWRPQELSFRVTVDDGLLASAPSEVHIVVGPGLTPSLPQVDPGADRRTRPGRTVILDAQAGVANPVPGRITPIFLWEQTFGHEVPLETFEEGRCAAFVAPSAPADLAFAVLAESELVQTFPAVTRITVVKEDDNQPPRIALTASSTQVEPGATVTVHGNVSDPEADLLLWCEWSVVSDPAADVRLSPGVACYPATTGATVVTFTAPPFDATVLLTLTALDELGGVGMAEVEVTVVSQ